MAVSGVSGNSAGIQFAGLASNVDTNKLVEGLLALHQAGVKRLQASQAKIQVQQATVKNVEAKLIAFQSQAARLAATFNSVFDGKTVASNAKELATGAASASAAAGTYSFRVTALARANQIASQGFSSTGSTITQGTLQIRVGSGATTTVTIDSSNNTLQGLATAINNAGADVTAALVNDGSAGTPYRLLLTAKKSGAANAITITNGLADSGGGATKPDLSTTVQPASDAAITIGSGAGALTVTSPTNQIEGAFTGLTINALAADAARDVSLTVSNDVETAKKAVQDFVNSYNDLAEYIASQSAFDTKTNQAGVLLGNSLTGTIQDTLARVVGSVVAGVNTAANRLSAVGITFDDKGKLKFDDTKLTSALTGGITGVTAADVRRLFALDGVSTNSGVVFIAAGDKTRVGAASLQVDVTAAARQASVTATNSVTEPINITGSNNTFSVTADGKLSSTLTLATGSYTLAGVAQELQARINADSKLGGAKVTVSVDSGKLRITSQAYGSASEVTVGAGAANAALGFAGTETNKGVDVAGKFIVDGVEEAATGSGQTLTAAGTNANTAGLVVRVTLTDSQLQPGADASLTLTRGVAAGIGPGLTTFLDPVNGRLKSLEKAYQDSINDLQKAVDAQNARIAQRQEALVKQFAAMEATIAKLKAAGDYVSGQFALLVSSSRK